VPGKTLSFLVEHTYTRISINLDPLAGRLPQPVPADRQRQNRYDRSNRNKAGRFPLSKRLDGVGG
jgi:hypothetical protein